jgi:hypothetical protein
MMKFPQANWIETSIVDDVTDKITGLPEIGPGSRTRSLVSCVQCLHVNTVGLSRDGYTLKGGIRSIRRSLSVYYFYSYLLRLLRVETHVWIKDIFECRCDERRKVKDERSIYCVGSFFYICLL